MKILLKLTATILLSFFALNQNAQSFGMCAGSSTVITAINSANLSNPTYSLNPGGLTSVNPTFVISPTASIVYTLYTTGTNTNSATVTTNNTVSVSVSGVTFSVVSPQNYTLGCNTKSVCTINIINATTIPMMGGPVSFTFLSPGNTNVVPSTGTLSPISSNTIVTPGTWSLIVRDNVNYCQSVFTVNVTSNTLSPAIPSIAVSQSTLSCNNPTTLIQVVPNIKVNYNWLPNSIQGHSLTAGPDYSTPTPSTAVVLTLQIVDNNSTCESDTVLPIYQNIYAPVANIVGPTSTCQFTAMLTNTSMSGIPPALYTATAPVVGLLWEGPAPQTTLALSSTYLAQTSGVYTMTAKDMNNGCTATATINVALRPVAAFSHTVSSGLVSFSDMSSGTTSNSTYFWNFGDGSTSTAQNPTHLYTNGGAHLVQLTVTNPGTFCADSLILSVTVSGVPCNANSGFSLVPTSTAQVWNVVPSYPWNISAATWSWGDGSTSNVLYTAHQYSAAGLYTICLSVTVNCVASSSTCTSYSVYRVTKEAMMIEVNVVAPALASGLSEQDPVVFNWNIVPNPNAGNFNLDFYNLNSDKIDLTVNDLTGRVIYNTSITAEETKAQVTFHELPPGMYFITVNNGGAKTTKRMIIKN